MRRTGSSYRLAISASLRRTVRCSLRLSLMCSLMLVLVACNLSRYTGQPQGTLEAADLPGGPTQVPLDPATSTSGSAAPAQARTPAPGIGLEVGTVRLAYIKDGNLWLWAGGKTCQLTTQGQVFSPRISKDGAVIAFLRPADNFHIELWAVNADGTQERRLVSIADLDAIGASGRDPNAVAINPYRFEWLGNSHSLVFNTQQVFNGPGLSLLEDLHQVNADGDGVKTLFPPGSGGEFAISPDGQQVALAKPDKLSISKLDSSDTRTLMSYTPVVTYSEYHYYALPSWSPEGTFLRVAIPPADPLADPPQPTSLWKLPLNGSNPLQEGTVTTVPFQETPLAYSPDLQRIAYLQAAGNPAENQRELFLATFDGQGQFVYAKGPLMRWFGWSPDSRHIAYSVGDLQELWLGAIDGTPQPFSGAQFGVSDLRWTSAEQFVMVQQRGETFSLVLADLSGKAVEVDTFSGQAPAFSAAP